MIIQAYLISPDLLISSIAIICVSVIIFLIGILITKWRAQMKNLDNTNRPAIILNLFWLIVNTTIYIIFNMIPYGTYFAFLISLGINIVGGAYLATHLYKNGKKESLGFVSTILLYLYIIGLILGFIALVIISLICIGINVNA